MATTILLPIKHDEAFVDAVTSSLSESTASSEYELVVVDRAHDGDSLASSILTAAKRSNAEVIVITSPSSRFFDGWLNRLVGALETAPVYSVAVPRTDAPDLEVLAVRREALTTEGVIELTCKDANFVDRLLFNLAGMGGQVVEMSPPVLARGSVDERKTERISINILGPNTGSALSEVLAAASNGAGVGELPLAAAEILRERFAQEEERQLLLQARGDSDVCWTDENVAEPLVTIRIATYNRAEALMDVALPAALNQTYENIEVVVVGDCTDEATVRAMNSMNDRRVRFYNLPAPSAYPSNERDRWRVSGSPPMNLGIDLAAGTWITTADDDDEMTSDHVEVLLQHARQNRLEFVWSKSAMETPDGWQIIGGTPMGPYATTSGAVMWSLGLRFMKMSNTCWKIPEPHDHNLYKRMLQIGVHMDFCDRVTYRYYPDAPAIATWQTVLLRSFAICNSPANVDKNWARRKGIDHVLTSADSRERGLEITNRVIGSEFEDHVTGLVRDAVRNCLRTGEKRLNVFAHDWDSWSDEHVRGYALGLLRGFSAAPGQPVPFAYG